ncbi:ABC transporter ATP-binding protein [Reinekea marina]|nr:ABC transporter ATP-binding protein [Reinekea marina]MDN3649310.1 ABC transporter ATP-binding protein [Reinekea marina]
MYTRFGFTDPYEFLFFVGLIVLAALAISAFVSMITVWKLAMFAAQIGTEIGDQLYMYYMRQSWLFHSNTSTAELTKNISSESIRITDQIIQPLMQMNSRFVLALFLTIGIVVYKPLVALVAVSIFLIAYLILFRLVRIKLAINGQIISTSLTNRFKLLNEGLGGIKDILLLNRQKYFVDEFKESGRQFSRARGRTNALWQVPRYFMEFLAFGAMISLVLYLISSNNGELGVILPVLAVYGFVGFKLLPAFQLIYGSISQIKGNVAAFESVSEHLFLSQREEADEKLESNESVKPFLEGDVVFKNVSFTYPNKYKPALTEVDLIFPAKKTVGVVGASGSGKSTLIDILLCLISPAKGSMAVNGIDISSENKRTWQNSIGFVPQSIFLTDGTIKQNVAFGVPESDIESDKVKAALKLAQLDDYIETLDLGIDTPVGERGVQLSGGQRQRIGIARALYDNASVLVFDEATSALDGITERMIMESIHSLSGKKSVVLIAHRLQTVKKCDVIYFIDNGKVVSTGTFDELYENSSQFRKMADHS